MAEFVYTFWTFNHNFPEKAPLCLRQWFCHCLAACHYWLGVVKALSRGGWSVWDSTRKRATKFRLTDRPLVVFFLSVARRKLSYRDARVFLEVCNPAKGVGKWIFYHHLSHAKVRIGWRWGRYNVGCQKCAFCIATRLEWTAWRVTVVCLALHWVVEDLLWNSLVSWRSRTCLKLDRSSISKHVLNWILYVKDSSIISESMTGFFFSEYKNMMEIWLIF